MRKRFLIFFFSGLEAWTPRQRAPPPRSPPTGRYRDTTKGTGWWDPSDTVGQRQVLSRKPILDPRETMRDRETYYNHATMQECSPRNEI